MPVARIRGKRAQASSVRADFWAIEEKGMNRRGATATEYGLLAALISVVLIASAQMVGFNTMMVLTDVEWAINYGDYDQVLNDFWTADGGGGGITANELLTFMSTSGPRPPDAGTVVLGVFDDNLEFDAMSAQVSTPSSGGFARIYADNR
jgi:Flp pilus assembly pilin Flp